MKKLAQSGFAAVELILAVVIVAAIAGTGYFVWHENAKSSPVTTASNTAASSYQSPTTLTPTAPQITTTSDLNAAMQTLNQTNITANNSDSSQLSTQASGF